MSDRQTVFSSDRKYRYTLWREFETEFLFDGGNKMKDGFVQFIGLNPSTADETQDDPTIRRCKGFAKAWGYGAMCMTNLFAWRDTSPDKMKAVPYPIGPENDDWLRKIAIDASLIVAAWGNNGDHMWRGHDVINRVLNLKQIHCIRRTPRNFPEHPLYLPKGLKPIVYAL